MQCCLIWESHTYLYTSGLIEYIFLYFLTNQLKTQNKNILEIWDQNHINIKVTFLYFFNQSAKNTK